MDDSFGVLIMGASYGALLGCKLAFSGHNVTLACLPDEAELINRDGVRIRLPVRSTGKLVEVHSKGLAGKLDAAVPADISPGDFDMAALAMQEPQYRTSGARELLSAIGRSRIPCMSIMNMPPLPYLNRVLGDRSDGLKDAYTEVAVWSECDPDLMTLASPDPQAFRPPDEALNVVHVGLPTNFKVARFNDQRHTDMLHQMERDIQSARFDTDEDGAVELPVKLRVHESLFVPMAKWPMLLAGNYRCVGDKDIRPIRDAVHGDFEASAAVYRWVCEVCEAAGAKSSDMVPFEKYANAARQLLKPSSAARALAAGVPNIERVDRLVQALAAGFSMSNPAIDQIVVRVDSWLERNRKAAG